ncbi:MAG: glutamate-1-semialdehyde 2,1-aminomutase [Candidatus Sericytochromatia bacterium]|nr:glutamate-1-semialdehyde 2,1-aminomutase [Candidatus Sericytochromatia bacterium]
MSISELKNQTSVELLEKAKEIIPGGVNSPVRAFKAVGGSPPFIKRAKGSKLWDEDNNEYIDYIGSWGPMILGHSNPIILDAIRKQLDIGTSFGAPTRLEVEMAELITSSMPSIEMVRMVNSGTEATMSAIRLARGYTGKNKIIKFNGCYHGHGDMLLVHAGSGVATLGLPDSPGVTKSVAQDTLTVDYNNIKELEQVFETYPYDIACVIIEPVTGNMGVVMPLEGYLQQVRDLCTKYDSLLIFDEVMTGFRVAYGGVQEVYNIKPDLTCLGKIIGGGLPVGAYGGKKEIMKHIAPAGNVYQAGTLSGNPLAMAAGIATLKELQKKEVYQGLDYRAKRIGKGFEEASDKYNIPLCLTGLGSMMCVFFTDQPVLNYEMAKNSNLKMFNQYFWAMHNQGIYLPPSQFEAIFISLAHSEEDLDKTILAIELSFKQISESM